MGRTQNQRVDGEREKIIFFYNFTLQNKLIYK